ncbi:MAG: hypothetical protein H7333_09010 [Bdellovibrionales bacterium]|nr:hypothetical protein [Oligoflexia bacterium]
MLYSCVRLLTLTLSFLAFEAQAGAIAPPPAVNLKDPLVMVSFGDSITAAAFANTSAGLPTSFLPSILNLANISTLFRQNLKETVVENKQFWSWASGIAISSHYNRLKSYFRGSERRELQIVNMAVSGSIASDVLLQVKKFSAAMERKPDTEIAYVTIMVGANDACNGVSLDESAAKLTEALDLLAKIPQRGKLKILVSSMPDVTQLGQPRIRNHLTGTFFLSCEKIRSRLLRFCNPLTHWSDDAELLANLGVIQDMNTVLANVATDANLHHGNLDVRYSNALSKHPLTFGILAADCFHPNIRGQQQISEVLWNDQPWFK